MSEIRWTNGKSEYTREEIEHMLETQRAMIYNDAARLVNANCVERGETGKPNKYEKNMLYFIKNCRKVDF